MHLPRHALSLLSALAALTAAPAALGGTTVTGTYGCTYDLGSKALLPTETTLKLTSTGRYTLGATAGKPSGTYKKSNSDTKLTFAGGPLAGKTGRISKNTLTGRGIQIRFTFWPTHPTKAEVCRR